LQSPVKKEKMPSMKSLTQLVAQMVMPRINGLQLEDSIYRQEIEALVREGLGGFILFGGTVEHTPARLAALQALATTPLLISSDVERGLGQQLQGGTRFPSQRAVAAAISRSSSSDAELLRSMLDAVRTETRAAGIQIVFSPVMDVNNNADNPIICTRAFGDEPEVVEWFGSRYITGLQRPNHTGKLDLLACAKHFPGHGDTDQDSHSVLPVIHADRARLNSVELPPFREAVKDGVGTIMVAHLLVPALDGDKPTTFSKKTITALLREGMAFDGLIVSDALDMGALAQAYSQEEIAVRAVAAGMDILLHPVDARVTIKAVAAAVEQGRLTRTRIEESVGRIRDAKMRLGLFDPAVTTIPEIDYEQHRSLARELSRRALQILSGDRMVLPLGSDGAACFMLDDDAEGRGDAFLRTLQAKLGTFSGIVLTPDTELQQSHLGEQIAAAGWVVIPIFSKISASKGRSGISPKLQSMALQIIAAAKAAKKRSVVISFDSPYILEQFQNADLCVAAYDRMDESQQAAAEMLVAGSRVQ
jgi:beta-glucosidase-like glycosyl hydrolase